MEVILIIGAVALFLFSRSAEGETEVTDSKNSPYPSVPSIVKTEAWRRYDVIFQRYANSYGVNWKWLKAFSLNESLLGTDPRTSKGDVSSDGLSWGIMQVTLATAIDLGAGPILGPELNNPDLSIQLAAKLVRNLKASFGADTRAIVMSYNEGPGNFRKGKVVEEYWARWQRWYEVVEANP